MKSFFYSLPFLLLYTSCNTGTSDPESVLVRQGGTENLSYVSNIRQGPQKVSSAPIPETVTFAGEPVPLDRPDVREALDYELMVNTFRHSRTLLVIKNIERWRPMVVEILREAGVPEDFLYLAVIESEFDNNALSFAGAMGMWQFMESTARDYNLKINKDVDMRRDPRLATRAAAEFLKWSHGHFNNWTLTAASYNRGVRGITNVMGEQRVDDFYDMHLNPETSRYVYRIIALKLILEDPEAYGYFIEDNEKYAPFSFKTIPVMEDLDLIDFAKQHNTTYKELRLLNPWFNNTSTYKLSVTRNDTFEIRVPVR